MVLIDDFVRSRLESLRALKEDKRRQKETSMSDVQKSSYLPISFHHLFDDSRQWAKEIQETFVDQTKLPLLYESYVTTKFDAVKSQGDQTVANIRRDIGNCKPSPKPRQWQMLDNFMQVCGWVFALVVPMILPFPLPLPRFRHPGTMEMNGC